MGRSPSPAARTRCCRRRRHLHRQNSAGPSVRAVESSVYGLQWRIRALGRVDLRWLLALSVVDARDTHGRYVDLPADSTAAISPCATSALALVRLGVHFALPGLLLDHCGGRVPACREDLKPGFYEGIKYNLRQSHLLSSTSSVFISRAGRMATKDRNPAIITRF